MSEDNKTNFKAPSTRSVLSFLFLPEFKRSFPAFAHIGPIFIRTIAIMFVQAGLLRPNHPAMMYGLAKDVPNFKFSDLIGEAWYNLRVNDGNSPYQYGMFVGVIMMICLTVVSAFMFITNMFLSTAQAQIFDHPTVNTDVGAATASTGGIFQLNPTSDDLAIDLLNRVIRQSAYGDGAPMSVSLGPLMGIYNTALLVIASLVVFWAIVSIIIDTARTGQIGGGRHSIVWVPIRFVFALGLMIPLGTGFSGGQLITLKIAEWGSNLATNGWIAYVDSVNDSSLVALKPVPEDIGVDLAYGLARIETCRLTYNGLNKQAGGSPTNFIYYTYGGLLSPDRNRAVPPSNWTLGQDKVNLYVGNNSVADRCGHIVVQNPNPETVAAVRGFGRLQDDMLEAFRIAKTAHYNAFFNTLPVPAEKVGCGLSHEYQNINSAGGSVCSSFDLTYADGNFPKADIINTAAQQYARAVDTASTAAYQKVVDYVTDPDFLTEMQDMGWAGMGVWYFKIQQFNSALDAILTPTVSVEQGSLELIEDENFFSSLFKDKEKDEVLSGTAETLKAFDEWWVTESAALGPNTIVGKFSQNNVRTESPQQNTSGDAGKFQKYMNKTFGNFNVIKFDDDLYPMAELINLGTQMVTMAIGGYVAVAALSLVGGTKILGSGPGVDTLITGPVGDLIGMMLTLLLGAGLLLKYYIPLIPWIRVLFAVLSWVISVFEAVVIVPLLALANLSTDGEGLFTQTGRNLWISSLQVILRPIMTVIGFVASLLIFNAIVGYVNDTYNVAINLSGYGGGFYYPISVVVYSIIYVVVVYSLINSTFKIMEELPSAAMKWMGGPQDMSFNDSNMEGYIMAASRFGEKAGSGMMGGASSGAAKRQGVRKEMQQQQMQKDMQAAQKNQNPNAE